MLEIRELTKQYGAFIALDHLTVTFDKGVYGLLGPNGAGKSTLLNLITDNIPRTEGEILYNGRDIRKLGAKYRRNIGYTPQLQGMYDNFTARDFLHYIGALKGMRLRECRRQTEEFLEIVNLSKDAHHLIGSFSGGMRQRVLLAAAMLDEPEILILDEPTVGLDPKERIHLCNYIATVARDRTVLLATHVVDDIESIAGRVLLLKQGKMCGFDSPAHLISGIRGCVGETGVRNEELAAIKLQFPNGKLVQREDGFCLRIVADELPERFHPVNTGITLEDVYLYHATVQKG